MALDWLADEIRGGGNRSGLNLTTDDAVVQRFALLTMDFATSGTGGSGGNGDDDDDGGGNKNNATTGDGSLRRQRRLAAAEPDMEDCDWEGVICDDGGNVVKLQWAFLELGGTIPSEIRLLTHLKALDLSNNMLNRRIPNQLYSLTGLESLHLYKNSLTGTISTLIGNLDSITRLHLSHNALSGTIPAELKSDEGSIDGIRPLREYQLCPGGFAMDVPFLFRSLSIVPLLCFDRLLGTSLVSLTHANACFFSARQSPLLSI